MTPSKIACLAVTAALLILPAAAIAQSAVGDQYCDPLAPAGSGNSCKKLGKAGTSPGGGGGGTSNGSASGTAGTSGSSSGLSEAAAQKKDPKTGLPATGVPIVAILGFGVALLASGLALRQVAVPPTR